MEQQRESRKKKKRVANEQPEFNLFILPQIERGVQGEDSRRRTWHAQRVTGIVVRWTELGSEAKAMATFGN